MKIPGKGRKVVELTAMSIITTMAAIYPTAEKSCGCTAGDIITRDRLP